MESYLSANHSRKYSEIDMLPEEKRDEIEARALAYEWYMCQYAAEHLEEIDYVRENYPYSYGDNKDFLEKARNDGEETYRRIQPKVGRNDPCPCGSGKNIKSVVVSDLYQEI